MKILVMIDSFKGTITSKRLGDITKERLEKNHHQVKAIPIADGGDGFLDAIEYIKEGQDIKQNEVMINDPLFRKTKSYYLASEIDKTCYIELAKASGINMLSINELNPFIASTYGLGEMIFDGIKKGYKKIIIGIGGSATNDAGAGMLEALKVKFYDSNKNVINHIKNRDFMNISEIDTTEFLELINGIEFIVLSDVANPLLGEFGATNVFSPQKGARKEDLILLENNIRYFSSFGKDKISVAGSGAAGGVGYCLNQYFKAKFYSGIDYILDLINFDELINNFDYIITGEGKIDNQSLSGKVIFQIASRSKKKNKPVILVCAINELTNINLQEFGIASIHSVCNDDVSKQDSMNDPEKYYIQMIDSFNL